MSHFALGHIAPVAAASGGVGTADLTGVASTGQTLTCTFNDDDPDGAASGVTYQWIRDAATTIVGETASTYVVQAVDVGHTLKCQVDYTDGAANSESIETADSATVVPGALVITLRGDDAINNNAAATKDFTGKDIGPASDDRWVKVAVGWKNATARTLDSASIGGVPATILDQTSITGSNGRVAILQALVPSGTTATISLTFSGTFTATTSNGVGITWFSVVGPLNATPEDSYKDETTNPPSKTFNYAANGVAIAVGTANNASRTVTGDFTDDLTGVEGFKQFAAGGTYWVGHVQGGVSANASDWGGSAWSASAALCSKLGYAWQPD